MAGMQMFLKVKGYQVNIRAYESLASLVSGLACRA